MKYSSLIIKLVVGLCILFNASTLTYASSKKHRCHKKHHHHHRSKSCKAESESESESKNRVRVRVTTGPTTLTTGAVTVTDTTTDTQAQAQAQLQAQIQNLTNQIAGCCNCSSNITPTPALILGGWFDGGNFTQTLVAGANQTLDFETPEVVSGINNDEGTFEFTQDGIYEVKVGVVSSDDESPSIAAVTTDVFEFQLLLDGTPVPGGVLEVQPRTPVTTTSLNTVSVLIRAKTGSHLSLKYINSCTGNPCGAPTGKNVTVGPSQSPIGNSAFITIKQLH